MDPFIFFPLHSAHLLHGFVQDVQEMGTLKATLKIKHDRLIVNILP